MSFASPLWWYALVGLAVPLVIHLLSRGRRQRIAIGSIRHVAATESRALRRIELSGWPLLLLRMALLVTLALALAAPRWPEMGADRSGSWLLIEPEVLDREDLPEWVDDWAGSVDAVRVLAAGLPGREDWEGAIGMAPDLWSLLREADSLAPRGYSFRIVTGERLVDLRGVRPALDRDIEWRTVADSRANRWIDLASRRLDGRLQVRVGESVAAGTRFRSFEWDEEVGPPESAGLRVDPIQGEVVLDPGDVWPDDDRLALWDAASRPLRVTAIAAENRSRDLWYLRQALTSLGRYLGRPVEWVVAGTGPVDLEIRLGESSAPESDARVRLSDSLGSFESCEASVPVESLAEPVRLMRCPTTGAAGVAVWAETQGRPFLTRLPAPDGARFRLESRFHPLWSDLVSGPALPRLLWTVLETQITLTTSAERPDSDRRVNNRVDRRERKEELESRTPVRPSTLPELLSWCLLAILLVAERWASRGQR